MRLLPQVTFETASPAATAIDAGSRDASALMRTELERAGVDGACRDAAGPVTVVMNDAHRMTDTRGFLDALFALLDERGVAPSLRLLVAAGSHRASAAEREAHEHRSLGPHRARFAEIAWHDAADAAGLAEIGGFGLHRWLAEPGLFLACGSAEPHYFAGVTGAHKTLTVGLMSLDSLRANHAGAMSPQAGPMRLAGNPVHEGIVAALRTLGEAGARMIVLNQVLAGGVMAGCAAGDPLEALEGVLPMVTASFACPVRAGSDLVIACVEPPLDRDFYQADKGIKNTEAAVRDGGTLILEARCEGGVGIDHFVELLRSAPTLEAARAEVDARGYRLGDHKAVRLRALTDGRGVALAVVSPHLDPVLGEVLGARIFADAAAAAEWADSRIGASAARGLWVGDAGNVVVHPGG